MSQESAESLENARGSMSSKRPWPVTDIIYFILFFMAVITAGFFLYDEVVGSSPDEGASFAFWSFGLTSLALAVVVYRDIHKIDHDCEEIKGEYPNWIDNKWEYRLRFSIMFALMLFAGKIITAAQLGIVLSNVGWDDHQAQAARGILLFGAIVMYLLLIFWNIGAAKSCAPWTASCIRPLVFCVAYGVSILYFLSAMFSVGAGFLQLFFVLYILCVAFGSWLRWGQDVKSCFRDLVSRVFARGV